VDTKRCNKCDNNYPLTEFYKHKSNAGGLRPQCKSCFNKLTNTVWKDSRRELRELKKENKIKLTPEQHKQKEKERRRVSNRGPEYAAAQKVWRKKYFSNPQKNLARAIRRRLYMAYRAQSKTGKTLEYLGCSWQELKQHLESQFKPGMTWENYGVNGWHIDHIKPLCGFDLINPEHLKIVCHYSNLRPLWAQENIAKIQTDVRFSHG